MTSTSSVCRSQWQRYEMYVRRKLLKDKSQCEDSSRLQHVPCSLSAVAKVVSWSTCMCFKHARQNVAVQEQLLSAQ